MDELKWRVDVEYFPCQDVDATLDPTWVEYVGMGENRRPNLAAIAKKCAECNGLQVIEDGEVAFVLASRIVKLVPVMLNERAVVEAELAKGASE